jgi:hypothetical protein
MRVFGGCAELAGAWVAGAWDAATTGDDAAGGALVDWK